MLAVEHDCCIAVKTDQRTVIATHTLAGTYYNCIVDITLLDLSTWQCLLYADLDDITNPGVTTL